MPERRIQLTRAPLAPVAFDDLAVVLREGDDVAIAKRPLAVGTVLVTGTRKLVVQQFVSGGHKLAIREIAPGSPVKRYGQIIGVATETIRTGSHVHTHNVALGSFGRRHEFCADYRSVPPFAAEERRTFQGFRRKDGRSGTRNYVAVLATVNCSASATAAAVRYFDQPGVLDAYPNVDGVIGLTHQGGCGAHSGSESLRQLQRALAGTVRHPNVGGYLILSLGCETNQPDDLIEQGAMQDDSPTVLTIQDSGGFAKTVERAIDGIRQLLPFADQAKREEIAASEIVLALQCGGSDGWSGITANPALGKAADLLVAQGGTVVLGETPEIYGAEHLLTRRARNPEVAQKLVDLIEWWEAYTGYWGASIDNNPSPGNKAGGLTTIYEKSLGAVAKAGSSPLNDVLAYAERITERGLLHMDSPGYDPVSVTGQVAGGCNVIAFTTGRGSAFGFKPAPSIKIATNSELYEQQEPDMDINAGRVLEGTGLDSMGEEIFADILAVASGRPTKSELAGVGSEEFSPWILGATL